MAQNDKALQRRIAPATPLRLVLEDDSGKKLLRNFRLCFDFNAAIAIQEKTGFSLIDCWRNQTALVIASMLWAAVLAIHGEYDTRDKQGERTLDGFEVIGSYITEENSDEILEALWAAYLNYVSPEKRKQLIQKRAEAESGIPTMPTPAGAAPENGTISDGATSGRSADSTSVSTMAKSGN